MKTIDMKSLIIGALIVVLIVISYSYYSQDENMGEIRANELMIVDDNDNPLIRLGHNNSQPVFGMFNENHNPILLLSRNESDGGLIILGDSEGRDRAAISIEDGNSRFSMYDEKTYEIIALSIEDGNSRLSMYDEKRNEIIALKENELGTGGAIRIFNEYRENVVALMSGRNNVGLILLQDRYGETGWAARGDQFHSRW